MPDGKRAILVDARIHLSAKLAALPSDLTRWAFIVLLCEAKWQDTPGRFKTRAHLSACMGERRRSVNAMLRVGLLEHDDEGGIWVRGWDHWQQVSDSTAAERMRRYRDRRKASLTVVSEENA